MRKLEDDFALPAAGAAGLVDGDDPMFAPSIVGADGDEDAEGGADQGVRDVQRTVRLWFEGDRLVDARVNTQWVAKLGSAEKLAEAFRQAFVAGMLQVQEEEPDGALPELHFPDLPPFDGVSLEAYLRMIDDHEHQWREAVERARAVELPERPIVQGKAKGVTVTLNAFGQVADVRFERPWIDTAQPGAIASHVVAAATQAQDQYRPVENPLADELEHHALQHRVLMAGFYALLNQPR